MTGRLLVVTFSICAACAGKRSEPTGRAEEPPVLSVSCSEVVDHVFRVTPSEARTGLVRHDMLADCREKLSPEQRRCITQTENIEEAKSCIETASTAGHKLPDTCLLGCNAASSAIASNTAADTSPGDSRQAPMPRSMLVGRWKVCREEGYITRPRSTMDCPAGREYDLAVDGTYVEYGRYPTSLGSVIDPEGLWALNDGKLVLQDRFAKTSATFVLKSFSLTLLYSEKRGYRKFSNGKKKGINIVTYFRKVD